MFIIRVVRKQNVDAIASAITRTVRIEGEVFISDHNGENFRLFAWSTEHFVKGRKPTEEDAEATSSELPMIQGPFGRIRENYPNNPYMIGLTNTDKIDDEHWMHKPHMALLIDGEKIKIPKDEWDSVRLQLKPGEIVKYLDEGSKKDSSGKVILDKPDSRRYLLEVVPRKKSILPTKQAYNHYWILEGDMRSRIKTDTNTLRLKRDGIRFCRNAYPDDTISLIDLWVKGVQEFPNVPWRISFHKETQEEKNLLAKSRYSGTILEGVDFDEPGIDEPDIGNE